MKNICEIYGCTKKTTEIFNDYCKEHINIKRGYYIGTYLESTFKAWKNMIIRKKTDQYGMDPKWKTFKGFVEDMGLKPEGTRFCKLYIGEGFYKDNCKYVKRLNKVNNEN